MNKNKFCIVAILLLFAFGIKAQKSKFPVDVEKVTRNAIYSRNGFSGDMVKDTLVLENGKKFLLNHTPLIFFDGYAKQFLDYESIVFLGWDEKGYTCTWLLKNNKLYLHDVHFQQLNTEKLPQKEMWEKRILKLTGETVDAEGRIAANWLSGIYRASPTRLDPFGKGLVDFDGEYLFYFNKGTLEHVKFLKKELIDIEKLPSNLEIKPKE